jgi:membrane protease YdiL (CAAX protease family)
MRKLDLARWAPALTLLLMAPLLLYAEYGKPMTDDPVLLPLIRMTLSRTAAAAVFFVILLTMRVRILHPLQKPFGKSILLALPAIAVVINNMPILSLITKDAYLVNSEARYIVWFALECLSTGLFEEIAFRGVILMTFLRKRRATHVQLLWGILLSSAVFGGLHLINLFSGAGVGDTVLQVGYSFLIGAMYAVILFKTANIWLCVVLHGIFNFGGAVVQYCGRGEIWDTFTVAFTAILAILVTVYMVISFLRADLSVISGIYCVKVAKIDKE